MNAPRHDTKQLETWLERLRNGDETARDALINFSCDRVRQIAHQKIAKDRVRRWESTDDVLQVALLKLHRALGEIQPRSLREYLGLASLQIRRTLHDLGRHYYGKRGSGRKHETDKASGISGARQRIEAAADKADGPLELMVRAEVHEFLEALPTEQREVLDLINYHGLKQSEIAELLGVSVDAVKKYRRTAYNSLSERLGPEYFDDK